MTTRTIFFRQLVVQAYVGILDHEKSTAQPLHIDAEFEVTAHPPNDALIDSVLDYRQLREAMIQECSQGHTNLLETLIERIGARIFDGFPDVQRLHIRIGKPTIFSDCAEVGIAIERHRQGHCQP